MLSGPRLLPLYPRLLPLYLCCALAPLGCAAQAPASNAVHCAIQPARAATEADRAFAAGDWARAEGLYAAQLAGPAAAANYAGVVKSQLEQNKLTEALATAQRDATALPASADAQALVGDVLLRSGQIPEAGTAYTKAVTLDPCGARGQFGLGRLSDLTSHRATAARKFAAAHTLAPGDPEIAAAFFETRPAAQRADGLRALLASSPVLGPGTVERLTNQLAALDQHKSCTVEQPFASARLELAPLMYDGVYVRSWGLKVRLDDAQTPLLELDSSVSGIVLSQKDAQHAGLHPLTTIPASADATYMAVADRVRIGTLEYHDCPVRVVPASVLADGNSLIGTDFFRDHLIHIDYVARLLSLDPFPAPLGPLMQASSTPTDPYIAPEEKDWSPVYIAGSNILIPTFINKQGPYCFLLDTGTDRTILSPTAAAKVLGTEKTATLDLQGTSGTIVKVLPREGGGDTQVTRVRGPDGTLLRVTTPVKLPVYRFTNNEMPDVFAISFDLSPKSRDIGFEVSGVMGFYVLRQYFIDLNYRDGLVKILYDQNQRYRTREGQ